MAENGDLSRTLRYRWLVFSLLAAAYLLVYFHRLCPAVVALDLMKDLSAGGALIGVLGSAYFYPYALMQIPAGLLSDSWGPRRTVTVFFLLAGAAAIFFAVATNMTLAIIARVLVGLGVSMLFVPTMKILTHWFRASEFAVMTGVLMAMGGVGALTAASPLAYLSSLLGWRGSFAVIGAITLVLAVAVWFCVRNRPSELGMAELNGTVATGTPQVETIRLKDGMKMVLSRRSFWPLAIWFFCTCAVFFSLGGLWGGPFLMDCYGLSKTQAGNVLSMIAFAMIIFSPLLSYLSDRVIHSRKKLLIMAAAMVSVLGALLVWATADMPVWFLYVFFFLLSVSSSAIVVIGFTSAKELFPVSIAGTSVGLVNFFPFLGGAVMQPVLGYLLDRLHPAGSPYPPEVYGQAFIALFVSGLIALAAACLCEETYSG
jgi:sugar phosphate permease